MKKSVFLAISLAILLYIFFSGCSKQTESPSRNSTDNTEDNVTQTGCTLYNLSAQEIERAAGAPFSAVDPFHGHRTNKIPLYKTDINLSIYHDGSVKGQRIRVQYGWSPKGSIMDAVVFKDDFTGKWLERERLTGNKEKIYEITLDNWGYVWYWPEESNWIFAKPTDNWEAMINNELNKASKVINYSSK